MYVLGLRAISSHSGSRGIRYINTSTKIERERERERERAREGESQGDVMVEINP